MLVLLSSYLQFVLKSEMHGFRAVIRIIVSFSKQNSVNVESQLCECSTTENVHRIT